MNFKSAMRTDLEGVEHTKGPGVKHGIEKKKKDDIGKV